MSNSVPDGEFDEYVFCCSSCGQQIEVNREMRHAILENGCPVCAADVETSSFEPVG